MLSVCALAIIFWVHFSCLRVGVKCASNFCTTELFRSKTNFLQVIIEMRSTRSTRKTRKQRGGAATPLPLSFFNPGSASFSASANAISTSQTSSLARQGIYQTGGSKKQQSKSLKGKKTQKQKQRGGFSPSVMGPFIKNVEALAAPLSIYLGWKMIKGLRGSKASRKK